MRTPKLPVVSESGVKLVTNRSDLVKDEYTLLSPTGMEIFVSKCALADHWLLSLSHFILYKSYAANVLCTPKECVCISTPCHKGTPSLVQVMVISRLL